MNENKENLKPVAGLKPFRKFCMTIGELPTSYLETMTYYEMLVWFTKYLGDTVIPTINNNAECIEELQNKYIEFTDDITTQQNNYEEYITGLFNDLQTFVNNYFDNLDVQEEINNKLDEMALDGTLLNLIEQATNIPKYFDCVSDMINFENHNANNYYITKGYYSPDDGGGAKYIVIEDSSTTQNGEYIRLTETLCAKMIIEYNTVNVRQFGCKGNNSTDDTTNFQYALSSSADKIYVPEGNYVISSTLVLPLNKTLYGCNANTCVLKGTNFDNYLITYGNSYDYGSKRGKISDIRLETSNENLDNQTYGLFLYSGCEIRNVYFNHLKQAISKYNNYIDNIVIDRCHIMYCGGKANSYIVDLPSNGDAILITQCQFGSAYNTQTFSNYLGIRIQNSTGILIENNIINVPITLNNVVASLINNHMEGPSTNDHYNLSNIMISNSNVLIDTLYIHKCNNKPEIAIQQETANEAHNCEVTLKNISIVLTSLMFKYYQSMQDMYDLYVGNQCVVHIDNVFNMLDYSHGWGPIKPATGIIVKNTSGLFDDFNKVSSIASIHSVITMNKVYINDLLPVNVGSSNTSLVYSGINNYTPWFESGYNNATLYYRKVTCYDFDRKLAASISDEKDITGITTYVNDSEPGKGANLNSTLNYMNSTIGAGLTEIFYRGNTTGSYDKITKVPICCARALYDFGTHISGHPTEERTAGNIDDFNIVTNFKKLGNNVEFTASSIPSYGTFVKGDRCINSIIATGNVKAWTYNGTNWVSEGTYA